jgi:hypothetical protein
MLAAADLSRPHKSDFLKHGQVLTHSLPAERQAVLHRDPRDEREECLPILFAQFVKQCATCGSGEGFEDVGHAE